MYIFMLTELTEVLDRLKQGPLQSPQKVEASDTSRYETDTGKGRRKNLSNKAFRMKKVYGATDTGRFFVTGPSNAANTAIWRLASSHELCIVCCRRSNEVAICQSSRNGKCTCCQMIRLSEPLERITSCKVQVCCHLSRRWTAASSKKNSAKTVVVSWWILWAPSSPQLPRVLRLGRDWAVFAPKTSLEVITFQLSTSSGNYWMDYLSFVGLGGQKLNLKRLSSTRLFANSD